MILFLEDWYKYPQAIPHFNTNNKSFVDICLKYKQMGIKNHLFPLALFDRDLEHINAHEPNLPSEIYQKIAIECSINPFYYIREVHRVAQAGSSEASPMIANRLLIAIYWLFYNHCPTVATALRQVGKSASVESIITNLLMFNSSIKSTFVTQSDNHRQSVFNKIRESISFIPRHLNLITSEDLSNQDTITVKARGNYLKGFVGSSNPVNANKVGRGATSPTMFFDETPFMENAERILGAALPAFVTAAEQAKKNGGPYGYMITTTAGEKNTASGAYVYNLLSDYAPFNERIYFDCLNAEDFEATVRKNSLVDRNLDPNGKFGIYVHFNHRQLGKTDEWLKTTASLTNARGNRLKMEYLGIWVDGSESSPLSDDDSAVIASNKRDPEFTEICAEGFVINWFIPEAILKTYLESTNIIVGLDMSEASGSDDIGLVIIDIRNMEVIGTGSYNNVNTISFSKFIVDLLVKHPNLTLIPESRSAASTIINYILLMLPSKGINPFTRVFNKVVHEKNYNEKTKARYEECMRFGTREQILNQYKREFGYSTSGKGEYSRENLYGNTFRLAIERNREKIKDPTLTHQLLHLIIKNGRIDHDSRNHDDMVIAWLLTQWMVNMGLNLESYGIKSYLIRQDEKKVQLDDPEQRQKYRYEQEQLDIKDRIDNLSDRLRAENNSILKERIKREIKNLYSSLNVSDEDVEMTLDNLYNSIKQKRLVSRMKY